MMSYLKTLVTGILLAGSTAAQAEITVIGNVIHLPDDGWYQVQLNEGNDSYVSICEGTRECTVENGDYIVINHTTGERSMVSVTGGSTTSGITVNGNTILWPDDGWYQVQRMDTYESICEGGRSCEVEPGNYIVINLTTNKRFENIVVDGEAIPESGSDQVGLGMGEHRVDGVISKYGSSSNMYDFFSDAMNYNAETPSAFPNAIAQHIDRTVRNATLIEKSQEADVTNIPFGNGNYQITYTTSQSSFVCDGGGSMTYKSVVRLAKYIADAPSSDSDENLSSENGLSLEFNFSECHSVFEFDTEANTYYPDTTYFPVGEYILNGSYKVFLAGDVTPSNRGSDVASHAWDNFSIDATAPSQWSLSANGYSYYSETQGPYRTYRRSQGDFNYQMTNEDGTGYLQGSLNRPLEQDYASTLASQWEN